jgi:hypothetical protein
MVHDKRLAAPQLTVLAESGAIPSQTEDRAVRTVLGKTCADVRVVVLDAFYGNAEVARHALGDDRRGVVGVAVAGDDLRASAVEL